MFDDIIHNDAAFERCFKEQFKTLCAYCQYKFGFDRSLAKEAVHTAFIKLWKMRRSLPSGISVKSYLYRIIINNCLDALKHEQIKTRYERQIQHQHSVQQLVQDAESFDVKKLTADINKAVLELPEQMRRIFELSRNEGMKYADIARHLNISINTVETQMSRALTKLRTRLAEYLPVGLALVIIRELILSPAMC